MTARALRLRKEARPLLWPWIVVSTLGAARLLIGELSIGPILLTRITTLLGAVIGIPLLATLPFSTEFQYHTLSVLLSQPEDRRKIWEEKATVAIAFAFSSAAFYYLSWEVAPGNGPSAQLLTWPLLTIITIGSAAYWTLIGRSTISGVMLNLMAAGGLIIIVLYCETFGPYDLLGKATPVISILAIALAGFMFWLGRRKFVRFESTGEQHGTDLMARPLGGAFRSEPTRPWRNLVLKELRLLTPVWLLALLAIASVVCLTPLHGMTQGISPTLATIVSVFGGVIVGIVFAIAPLLAGTLSVGEERNSGTQIWNLMLPLSIRRQWIVKFVTGLLSCLAAQALVLLVVSLIGDRVFDKEFVLQIHSSAANGLGLLAISIGTFVAAFWSACAINGTVRATLLTVPLGVSIASTTFFGFWLGSSQEISNACIFLVATFHPYPYRLMEPEWIGILLPFVLLTPLVVVAAFQGYRMFRRDARSADWGFIGRRILPLLILALVSGISISAARILLFAPYFQEREVMREIHAAAVKLYIDAGRLDPAHPLPVTAEDLAKIPAISRATKAWVRNATIAIFLTEPTTARDTYFGPKMSPYYISVAFANGRECRAAGYSQMCTDPQDRTIPGNGPFVPALFVSAANAEAMAVSRVKPVLAADQAGRSATVSLKVAIGENGSVLWVRPLSGEEPFTSAATNAVQQWRYQPVRFLGWPAHVITSVTLSFP